MSADQSSGMDFAAVAIEIAERCCERVKDHPAHPDLETDVAIQISDALVDAYNAGRELIEHAVTEHCLNEKCPRGGVPVKIITVGASVKGLT